MSVSQTNKKIVIWKHPVRKHMLQGVVLLNDFIEMSQN